MKILITAGPTREMIDPVRFLSNRSSGKMGYAVAGVAAEREHEVRLVSGPVAVDEPKGVSVMRVVSAADMLEAVLAHFGRCDILIMCAAVADWRPKLVAEQKLKKAVSGDGMTLELERTVDILKAVGEIRQSQVVVGFAAETENMLEEARRKLVSKGLDMIVANDVSRADAGFEVDTNAVTFVTADDETELPLMGKREVAVRLVEWLEERGCVLPD